MTFKIVKVNQTCIACPTQFDAWTDTGKYLYMRYRSGHGTVRMFDSEHSSHLNGVDGNFFDPDHLIADFRYGGWLDGSIGLEKFCELAGLELAENADIKLWPEEDYEWDDNPPWARD